jgi:HTH domain
MRASRLVSIILLLQARGRLTAAQLAKELDVSVRIRRISFGNVRVRPQRCVQATVEPVGKVPACAYSVVMTTT